MEVSAGTSDAAIIDLLMAAAMTGEGTSYPDLTYDSQGVTTEEYGIGCRKGSDLAQYINNVLAEAYADGTMKEIATTYKLQDALVEQPAAEEFTPAADGDVAYIQDKGEKLHGVHPPLFQQRPGGGHRREVTGAIPEKAINRKGRERPLSAFAWPIEHQTRSSPCFGT